MTQDISQLKFLGPTRFAPIYKDYIWGGRRLITSFKRKAPEHMDVVAESWEISAHSHGVTQMSEEESSTFSLSDLYAAYGRYILGDSFKGRPVPENFPLMLKYLDAAENLSVQVHPNAEVIRRRRLEDPVEKTEAWIVIDREPGSFFWIGLNGIYTRQQVEQASRDGSIPAMLNCIFPEVGDCFLIEPGSVHSLGKGILVVEIQHTSDTTFRLYDWGRVDKHGNPRTLHLEEALDTIHYSRGPVHSQVPERLYVSGSENGLKVERLVDSPRFNLLRWEIPCGFQDIWYSDEHAHLWTVLNGEMILEYYAEDCVFPGRILDPSQKGHLITEYLRRGDSVLIPACCRKLSRRSVQKTPELSENTVLLDAQCK